MADLHQLEDELKAFQEEKVEIDNSLKVKIAAQEEEMAELSRKLRVK